MTKTTELFATPDAGSGAPDDLATACQYTAELIHIAGVPPQYISIRRAHTSIEIQWPAVDPPLRARPPAEEPGSPQDGQRGASELGASELSASEPQDDREYIRAPLVGTFHRAVQPGGKPFVKVGDHVEPGQQVAIVEAMKLMNPVEADRPGCVAEFLLPDGTAVEYGQALIAIVSPT
jgi:acetyl-CoA carboxylase biotin carboxyl carrier protein